jgi:hypothetical protein
MTFTYGANTDPDERAGELDAGRKVTNIRVGGHADQRFDRVVFDLSGTQIPGWHVAYTESAVQDGSGATVDVPGAAVLTVVLRGINWTDAALPEYGGAPIDGPGGSIVGVRWGGSFEGQTQAFVGTSGRLPFRVAALDGPNRVYIDVAQV